MDKNDLVISEWWRNTVAHRGRDVLSSFVSLIATPYKVDSVTGGQAPYI